MHASASGPLASKADPFASYIKARPKPTEPRVWPDGATATDLPEAVAESGPARLRLLDFEKIYLPRSTKANATVNYREWQEANVVFGDDLRPTRIAEDPFASYLRQRPRKKLPDTTVEQGLREDCLRAKRQLLEFAISCEIKALDPTNPADAAERLKLTRRARRYLEHPEWTREVLSDSENEGYERTDRGFEWERTALASSSKEASDAWRKSSLSSSGQAVVGDLAGKTRSLLSASAPDLAAVDGASRRTPSHTAPAFFQAGDESPKKRNRESICGAWCNFPRSWNIAISERDLCARRQHRTSPGGGVVFGKGRCQTFVGKHLLCQGQFFSFNIDKVDDDNFPVSSVNHMTLAVGVSRRPVTDPSCKNRMYAYEVPKTVLLGYGSHLVDDNKWTKSPWDPLTLEAGDVLGILVTPDGDLTIFINSKQVLRVKTSLAADYAVEPVETVDDMGVMTKTKTSTTKKTKDWPALYPIVDLCGRVQAVSLNKRCQPPNVALNARSKMPK